MEGEDGGSNGVVATIEKPVEQAPPESGAESSELAASAESAEVQPAPESGSNQETELTFADILADPDKLKAAYAEGITPEEIREEIARQARTEGDVDEAEKVRREADRIVTRQREAEETRLAREGTYEAGFLSGAQAARSIVDVEQRYNALIDTDPDAAAALFTKRNQNGRLEILDHIDRVYAGAIARTSLDFERTLGKIEDDPDFKAAFESIPEDAKRPWDDARYEFATKGSADARLRLMLKRYGDYREAQAIEKAEKKTPKIVDKAMEEGGVMAKLRKAGLLANGSVTGGAANSGHERGSIDWWNSLGREGRSKPENQQAYDDWIARNAHLIRR